MSLSKSAFGLREVAPILVAQVGVSPAALKKTPRPRSFSRGKREEENIRRVLLLREKELENDGSFI